MKLTIKTLKQIAYTVEIGQEALVNELKEEIEKKHGFDAKTMKLLYNGVVLDDKKSLSEAGMKESHIIMMMNSKAKPHNQIKEEKKEEEPVPVSNNTSIPAKSKDTQAVQQQPSEAKDYSKEIKQLNEMGFSEDMTRNAITAAKGNLNLAIEFLYNGIPAVSGGPQLSEFYDEEGEEGDLEPIELDPEMLNSLDLTNPNTLKTIASIVKILIQEDPSQLQDLLADIEETNPEIIDYIKEHETEFKSLIQQPLNDEDVRMFNSLGGADQQIVLGDEEEALEEGLDGLNNYLNNLNTLNSGQTGLGGASATNLINLSQNDKDAVERLKNLGFSETEALQAYMVCEKNETLAANFLFDNKFKEGDMNVDCKEFLILGDASEDHDPKK